VVYSVRPRVVLAWTEKDFPNNATRWKFDAANVWMDTPPVMRTDVRPIHRRGLLLLAASGTLATMEDPMRSRLILFTLSLYLALAVLGCTTKPPADTTDNGTGTASDNPGATGKSGKESKERKEPREAKREPITVPASTTVTVSLGSAIGSKLSQAGQTFTGSVAKDVLVGNTVAIPRGASVSGTVADAKPLGRFAGGAVLQLRLDSINLNGSELPVQTALRTFSAKGKGKRTALMTGGGAAVGGIIGALAGGGKGAAIGMAAGGGAGAGGAAFTGNKDIVLPAESAVSFELSQPLEVRR
jgi:hypothetical protein